MKKEIHPENYRLVVFQDVSCDYSFLTHSTVKTTETIKWDDGNEYPLYKLEISNKSHPYFTGKQNLVDSAGRIEKFNRKYNISAAAETVEAKEKVVETEVKEDKSPSDTETVEAKEKVAKDKNN